MSATPDSLRPGDPHCEVLVIGGGPAGSTISALLAARGRDVVMLEKARHPRFHIGESLLPLNLPLFQKLGVEEEIARIGLVKRGAEFVSQHPRQCVTFQFADAWDRSFPYAYQVRRAEFDEILFRNAVAQGAKAEQGCKVTRVEFQADGALVQALGDDGRERRWRARFVVDASGRDTLLANQLGIKRRNRRHNSAAVFGHFAGARRLSGEAEGNISIFWFEHGWFWFIPLTGGVTSVGAVCWPYYLKTRQVPPERFLLDTIALCPELSERLQAASLVSPVTATGNYSYSASRSAGKGYLMVGDAYAFIDPVFSSGVFLAMQGAFDAADTVAACLDQPQRAAAALKAYDASLRRGPRIFSWYIYRVTAPTMRELFLHPRNTLRMRDALLSLLAGDLFRGTPTGPSLLAFKAVYYLGNLFHPGRSLRAWRQRKRNIRPSSAAAAPR